MRSRMIARNYLHVRSVNQYRLVTYDTLVHGGDCRIVTVEPMFPKIMGKRATNSRDHNSVVANKGR